MSAFNRVVWIVLDSVGIGEMPDAADYGDVGSDTLGNIAMQRSLKLPNLCSLGLGNIKPLAGLPPAPEPIGAFGRCTLASPGKDTTTGHWEMAGIHLDKPFPLYPRGFPSEIMHRFEERIGRKTLGNMRRLWNRDHRAARQGACPHWLRRSFTHRPTACFRSPRMNRSFRSPSNTRSAL